MDIANEIWNIIRDYNPREAQERELRDLQATCEKLGERATAVFWRCVPDWYKAKHGAAA